MGAIERRCGTGGRLARFVRDGDFVPWAGFIRDGRSAPHRRWHRGPCVCGRYGRRPERCAGDHHDGEERRELWLGVTVTCRQRRESYVSVHLRCEGVGVNKDGWGALTVWGALSGAHGVSLAMG